MNLSADFDADEALSLALRIMEEGAEAVVGTVIASAAEWESAAERAIQDDDCDDLEQLMEQQDAYDDGDFAHPAFDEWQDVFGNPFGSTAARIASHQFDMAKGAA